MPPPPLPTKITSAAFATKAVTTNSSSSSPTTQPATLTSDISNSPTPPTGRTIRITSSCNYTKPIIRLNLKKLNSETVTSTTTASLSFAPTASVRHQAPKIQEASHSVSSPFPVSTPAALDLSQVSLSSTSKQTNSPKTTQPVVSTIKNSNGAHSSNGSRCNSNISLPPDYDCDLNDEDGTTDEPDPDPDLRRRRRHTRPQLTRSPSLHPLPLPTKQGNQIQAPEMNCSVDDEDPFKKLGLKPYSPIWLPSRTPSFEMMRQRSYSPNPRHGMTIRPSPVHDGEDVVGEDDRDILGFDLHEPLREEEDKSNKKNLTTAAGKERQEPGSSRLYERFGSIKKRSSPLLPDHYDDLEDYDVEEMNFQMADAKTNCMSTTKRPRRDHAQDQSQVPPPPSFLPPNANNINIRDKHSRAESTEIVEDPGRTHNNDQSPSSPIWSDNNNGNHDHPYRQQLYGNQRLPSSQHRPHSHYQPHHHRPHSQQHENNYSYNHHHQNHQTNRPYLSRPWTSYRGNSYQHPGGLHHTRDGFHPGNGGDGDEGNNRFQHERVLIGRRRGRGRGFGRGRGRGRGGYDNAEFYNRYHFPPRQGGRHEMNPFHQPQHQHHVGDEGPTIDTLPLEIANGNVTGTATGTVSDHSSASHPPSSPPQGHVTDPHPLSSSSLSIASSSRTTLHFSPNLNHHIHASAQQNEKHSQANSSNSTEPSTLPQSLPTAPPSSAETMTTVAPLSKSMTSTTTSLPYYLPSSFRTPSSPPPPPPPRPAFISHHSTSPHNSISASKSFSKSPSRSFSRSFSRSYSRSRSPSPATLASSAQTRLTRYAASEISSLAQKLTTEQTLRVQAQKQIRFLTQSLRDLEERNQLVEQNYEVLLARYSREVRK